MLFIETNQTEKAKAYLYKPQVNQTELPLKNEKIITQTVRLKLGLLNLNMCLPTFPFQ